MTGPPPAAVLDAFGVRGEPVLLDGGMRRTWLVGEVVLKPVVDVVEHAWVADVYDAWPGGDVRVPQPLRVQDAWSYRGWGAHVLVPGTTARLGDDPEWFRDACTAFHEAIAGVARPAFLDWREDAWSYGERVAWDGLAPLGGPATLARLERASSRLEPVDLPSQAVHGDLGGNLLRDGDRPGVIDWPAYWRPASWSLAVVATDAVCWEDADLRVLEVLACGPHWPQLLLRAAIYRLATEGYQEVREGAGLDHDGYLAPDVWDWIERRL